MYNKYATNPIEHQKMLLMYNNIKIKHGVYEAIDNLQKAITEVEEKNSSKGLEKNSSKE